MSLDKPFFYPLTVKELEENNKSLTSETTQIAYTYTELFELVHSGNLKELKKLIGSKFHVDAINDKGHTLLHYACLYKQQELASYLIKKGATLDSVDNYGNALKKDAEERGINLVYHTEVDNNLSLMGEFTEDQSESCCNCLIQ